MTDINVGQFSEALNDKADRDLHNVDTTAKADAVIDFQLPTAENNYTWYRKYKSGWVEQGGGAFNAASGSDISVIYPIAFSDDHYTLTLGLITTNDSASGLQWSGAKSRTSTGFVARVESTVYKSWYACGIAA